VSLPVDPERLKQEFPELTDADLAAYVSVTRRILEAPTAERGRLTRDIVSGGREAREKAGRGAKLTREEALWSAYLEAVDKMQRSTARRK
jgi:hypothetical protein